MTPSTASIDISAAVAVGTGRVRRPGMTLHRVEAVGRWVGAAGLATARWFRAGQLDAGPSLELSRWSGGRC